MTEIFEEWFFTKDHNREGTICDFLNDYLKEIEGKIYLCSYSLISQKNKAVTTISSRKTGRNISSSSIFKTNLTSTRDSIAVTLKYAA